MIVAAREHGIADERSPVSIAGGAIYFACLLLGVSKAVKDISMVAGENEGPIKLVYRLYYTDRTKLVKKEWIADGKVNMDRLPVETTK
jgi:transcription initiation factor TFIIB